MKKLCSYLYKKKVILFLFFFVFFLVGFIGCDFVNRQNCYYTATLKIENIELVDIHQLSNLEYLNSIKQSADKYKNIDVEKMMKKNDFIVSITDQNVVTITTKSKYYDTFFNSKTKSVGTRAKTFIKDAVDYLCQEKTSVLYDDAQNIIVRHQYTNPYKIACVVAFGGLILSFILLSYLYFRKDERLQTPIEFDNEQIYKTIFHRSYFKQALHSVKGIRDMSNIAMLFAIMILCKFIKMPSGFANLGISFTYLFFAVIAMIYGPFVGFFIGVCSDVIGYIIAPSGVFFPPYIIQAALTGMIYGFCFYKTSLSFGKVLLARSLINFFMNVIYGSFCFGWMYGYSKEVIFSYMLLVSLPKNIVYLLPQSLLLYYVFKMAAPVLYHFKLMDERIYKNIRFVQ